MYIGIDLGTSAVKLLLMEKDGKIPNIVNREYPIAFPHPGWSEQDPTDWWNAVKEGIPALLHGFDASQVKGIGVGGQMHGLVVLDKDDNIIRPCILWNDGRTQPQVDHLNQVVGKEKLSQYTANIAFAGFTVPKLLWMRQNEPALFAHADCAQKLVKIKSETRPDPELVQKYNAKYAVWKQLYPLLRPIEKEL